MGTEPRRPDQSLRYHTMSLKMTRSRRLTLLAGGIIACALGVCFLLPFWPKVTFQERRMMSYIGTTGMNSEVSLTLQNDGYLPIWYLGNEWRVGDLTIERDLKNGKSYHHSTRDLSWNAIAPGESKKIPLPLFAQFGKSRIKIKLRDWRGYEAECLSNEF